MLRSAPRPAWLAPLLAALLFAAPASARPVAGNGGSEAVAPDRAFPVRGAHDFGVADNRFGGGRGHGGQDVLAACGTPVVAALSGNVRHKATESAAGHYVVIEGRDGADQVYMHLARPSRVDVGERVEAGETIGRVGQTGRASTCHLHFELWRGEGGWYGGGRAVDPLPALERWDAAG